LEENQPRRVQRTSADSVTRW